MRLVQTSPIFNTHPLSDAVHHLRLIYEGKLLLFSTCSETSAACFFRLFSNITGHQVLFLRLIRKIISSVKNKWNSGAPRPPAGRHANLWQAWSGSTYDLSPTLMVPTGPMKDPLHWVTDWAANNKTGRRVTYLDLLTATMLTLIFVSLLLSISLFLHTHIL